MSNTSLRLLVLLSITPASLSAVQKPGNLNLSQTCFDSLPYGEPHACELVVLSKNNTPIGTLYAIAANALATDSLAVTNRDSTADRVLLEAADQDLHGRCAAPFVGLDSLHPRIAVHFDATRHGKDTGAALLIRASARTASGVIQDHLAIAICVAGYYLDALNFPDVRR